MSANATYDLLATNRVYGQMCRTALKNLPTSAQRQFRVHVSDSWRDTRWNDIRRDSSAVLVFSRLADITVDDAPAPAVRNRLCYVFTEGMPSEAIAPRISSLNLRSGGFHLDAEPKSEHRTHVVERMIRAYVSPDFVPIIDAWWEHDDGGSFVVLSPNFKRIAVPRKELAKSLRDETIADRDFEIDPDGSFVYWPEIDGHLGWKQFQHMVDPDALNRARANDAEFCVRYGAAIREVRIAHDLAQTAIDSLTDRHVRRIENGEMFPTKKAIASLAKAHGLPVNEYLAEVSRVLG